MKEPKTLQISGSNLHIHVPNIPAGSPPITEYSVEVIYRTPVRDWQLGIMQGTIVPGTQEIHFGDLCTHKQLWTGSPDHPSVHKKYTVLVRFGDGRSQIMEASETFRAPLTFKVNISWAKFLNYTLYVLSGLIALILAIAVLYGTFKCGVWTVEKIDSWFTHPVAVSTNGSNTPSTTTAPTEHTSTAPAHATTPKVNPPIFDADFEQWNSWPMDWSSAFIGNKILVLEPVTAEEGFRDVTIPLFFGKATIIRIPLDPDGKLQKIIIRDQDLPLVDPMVGDGNYCHPYGAKSWPVECRGERFLAMRLKPGVADSNIIIRIKP